MAVRSKAWVCGHSVAGIAGSNPAGAWISVSCECCVLSGRGLCFGLITHPEESVSECAREAWADEKALAHWWLSRPSKKCPVDVVPKICMCVPEI